MSALGADLCFVGRPVVYGLVAGGSAGARRVLDLLTEETAVALAFTGTVTLSGCGPAVLSPLS
jgi:isopentenyl diphosphate isomerase/L-lactate dehydrogenase-like FMN-dependent dehydrogenase